MRRELRRLAAVVSVDVAGYSRLMGADDSGTLSALKRDRRELVDPTIAEYGGRIVKTTGDGLLLEFPSVVDAVRCAVDVQRGMAARNSRVCAEKRLEFRVGINVGDIILDGDDIFGDGVNVAVRVEALADPGGICLSNVAYEQVRDKLDLAFEDLGPHELKNIARSVEIFRVVLDRGARSAPSGAPAALATASGRSNLPVDQAPLYGRIEDLQMLRRLVEAHRLVSIVGTGGIGKTRLASSFAHSEQGRYDDGIWWVDLATETNGSSLVTAIGATLGIGSQLGDGARLKVIQSLRARRALIVLDNCEMLLDAVADFVAEALAGAAQVRWLITSQQPLKLADEQVYRLGPLAFPSKPTDAKHALEFGAITLLAQQVTALDCRFAITDANAEGAIDLCAKLDGIPLAIQMAAARIPTLGLDRVRTLLGERLRFLASGHRTPLARQQTLHAALDWSHSLLTATERVVLRRLGVFAGGFTLELAREVVGCVGRHASSEVDEWETLEALEGLIEKSMVQALPGPDSGDLRYALLETTRLYALDRLTEASELEVAHGCHAQTMARFAERACDDHWTEPDRVSIARMKPEIDNLRTALHWAVAHGDADSAASIVGNTWHVFRMIDRQYEIQAWMNMAEPLIRQATGPRAARAVAAVVFAFGARGGVRAVAAAREAVQRYRELDDQRGLYLALCTLAYAGSVFSDPGSDSDRDAQVALAELDRLERPEWPARLRCWATVARTYVLRDDVAARLGPLRAMRELAHSVGATERALTAQVNMLGALCSLGRNDEAIELARNIIDEGLLAGERLGDVLLALTGALATRNRFAEAREYARDALHVLGQCNGACEAFTELASIALTEGRVEDAARVVGYAEAILESDGIERGVQVRAIEGVTVRIDSHISEAVRKTLMAEGARLAEAQATSLALRIGTR